MSAQNALFDLATRLMRCGSDDARWACGVEVLRGLGSDWVTAGTANRSDQTGLSIRSTTPQVLMRDYMAERIYLDDPWMAHCASSPETEMTDLSQAARGAGTKLRARQARLFLDHGVRRAVLLPSYGGARPGGLVLYARSEDASERMASPEGHAEIRLATAFVAAFYRPEDDRSDSEERYRITPALSAREREVLEWLSRGLQSAAIADRMRIEPVTVAKHLHNARRKLGGRTREQALAIAVRDRLIAI